jgi:hypothetical protein
MGFFALFGGAPALYALRGGRAIEVAADLEMVVFITMKKLLVVITIKGARFMMLSKRVARPLHDCWRTVAAA